MAPNDTRVTRRPGFFAPVPEAALQPVGSNPTVYVVEWDIPSDSAAKRVRFYRALKKIWKDYGAEREMSTKSVFVTSDADFAKDVFGLAKGYGVAHLYEARQIE
jgi:hypothetical protein